MSYHATLPPPVSNTFLHDVYPTSTHLLTPYPASASPLSGACEAAVGALKRHDESIEVVVQACYAIHFLCFAQNNISWMGANGACEAVTQALTKHIQDDIMTTQVRGR